MGVGVHQLFVGGRSHRRQMEFALESLRPQGETILIPCQDLDVGAWAIEDDRCGDPLAKIQQRASWGDSNKKYRILLGVISYSKSKQTPEIYK